jgi:hypothetical protein
MSQDPPKPLVPLNPSSVLSPRMVGGRKFLRNHDHFMAFEEQEEGKLRSSEK